METLFIVVLCVGGIYAFKRHVRKRGARYVRACAFLNELDKGQGVDAANGCAMRVFSRDSDPDQDRQAIDFATMLSKDGAKQLPIIQMARRQGFID